MEENNPFFNTKKPFGKIPEQNKNKKKEDKDISDENEEPSDFKAEIARELNFDLPHLEDSEETDNISENKPPVQKKANSYIKVEEPKSEIKKTIPIIREIDEEVKKEKTISIKDIKKSTSVPSPVKSLPTTSIQLPHQTVPTKSIPQEKTSQPDPAPQIIKDISSFKPKTQSNTQSKKNTEEKVEEQKKEKSTNTQQIYSQLDANRSAKKPLEKIEVPLDEAEISKKLKIERISTDIPGFDDLIEGGFEKNSTNLLAGSPGVGKSIFATQFLIAGMKNKERCLYVSFEEKKEPFFANMAEFGWNLYQYENKGLFTFLEYSPSKVKTMLDEGGGDIESIIVKNKVTRIILDSISAFTLLFENELEKREASLSLINMIKKWNCTSLLTYESQSVTKEQSTQFRTLDFESDSIIALYLVRNKNKRERFLEVMKMRGTNHSNSIFSYKIDNSGFNVSTKPTENLPDL